MIFLILCYDNSMKKYVWFACISIGLIAILVAYLVLFPIGYFSGGLSNQTWNAEQEFSLENTITLQKDPNRDFVVLNLADVQFENSDLLNGTFANSKALISTMIAEKQPDLITMTGDNFTGSENHLVIKEWVEFIDEFQIPWAPVMGNHDWEGSGDYNWVADEFLKSEYCILEKGPAEMGVGNYVITIMEQDTLVHALIMMHTHNYVEDGYDHVWPVQQEWYSWVINGLSTLAQKVVPTSVIFHIPLVEYADAWEYWSEQNFDPNIGFGEKNERVDSSKTNNGFFTLLKNLNSTKLVLCGHEHLNHFSILYQGIRLTYAVKSSLASYHNDNLGGTVLSISSAEVSVEQLIV